MAIPGYQDFMLPLLKLGGDGKEHTPAEAVEGLFKAMRLSDEDRQEVAPNTLMRAAVACDDVLAMLRGGSPDRRP